MSASATQGGHKNGNFIETQCTVLKLPSSAISMTMGSTILANVNVSSRSLYAIARPSVVCLSVVCNARAPYSGG